MLLNLINIDKLMLGLSWLPCHHIPCKHNLHGSVETMWTMGPWSIGHHVVMNMIHVIRINDIYFIK